MLGRGRLALVQKQHADGVGHASTCHARARASKARDRADPWAADGEGGVRLTFGGSYFDHRLTQEGSKLHTSGLLHAAVDGALVSRRLIIGTSLAGSLIAVLLSYYFVANKAYEDRLILSCDKAAASPGDPDRPKDVDGVEYNDLDGPGAIDPCEKAYNVASSNRRIVYELGRALDKSGRSERALKLYSQAADQGSTPAMVNLGSAYMNGTGVAQDYVQARLWFEKAAAEGNAIAMSNLATQAELGKGKPQDINQAIFWHKKAASLGNTPSMIRMAHYYEVGLGVGQDYLAARSWYEKAALNGNAQAMALTGVMYYYGRGVPEDKSVAVGWYEKAAALGNPIAMTILGVCYKEGQGVGRNYSKAREWFEKGAAAGHATAMQELSDVYKNGLGVPRDESLAKFWLDKFNSARQ
jgi:uncharacterized protein